VANPRASILSFGYGKRSFDECLALLQRHGVQYVIDVRSTPWSRFKPEFSRETLDARLRSGGLRYVFMGAELGGRPDDPTCYDEDGRVDYLACRERRSFQQGIERLLRASESGHRVAIMCSEGRPEDCHRAKLVASVLCERGVEVQHIDECNELRSHDEILARLHRGQLDFPGIYDAEKLHKSRGRYMQAARS